MIWHIFSKDLKLLWPFVLLITAAQALSEWLNLQEVWLALENGNMIRDGVPLAFQLLVLLGAAILIGVAMHQDSVENTRQDWRTRPVSRMQVLLAKLLFVLLAVHLPMLVIQLTAALSVGFPFDHSLGAAALRTFQMFICGSLPVMALASQTRNMVQLLIAGLVLSLAGIAYHEHLPPASASTTYDTGMEWLQFELKVALILLGSVAVLLLRYSSRGTAWVRAVSLAALAVGAFAYLPATTAFAMQRWLGPASDVVAPVTFTYAPSAARVMQLPGSEQHPLTFVEVPLKVSGIPANSRLLADGVEVALIDAAGNSLYRGKASREVTLPGDGTHFESFFLPTELYTRIRSTPVRLELRYTLALLEAGEPATATAMRGLQWIPGIGVCTWVPPENHAYEMYRCVQTGEKVMDDEADHRLWPQLRKRMFDVENKTATVSPGHQSVISGAFRSDGHFLRTMTADRVRLEDLTGDSAPATGSDGLAPLHINWDFPSRAFWLRVRMDEGSSAGRQHDLLLRQSTQKPAKESVQVALRAQDAGNGEIAVSMQFEAPASLDSSIPAWHTLATAAVKVYPGERVTVHVPAPGITTWHGLRKLKFSATPRLH